MWAGGRGGFGGLAGECVGGPAGEYGLMGRDRYLPRATSALLSAKSPQFNSKIIIKIVNKCEKFSKFNMTPVMMYITYIKVVVVKLKFEFIIGSKQSDISSYSLKLPERCSSF
jgi:hypothetical protein